MRQICCTSAHDFLDLIKKRFVQEISFAGSAFMDLLLFGKVSEEKIAFVFLSFLVKNHVFLKPLSHVMNAQLGKENDVEITITQKGNLFSKEQTRDFKKSVTIALGNLFRTGINAADHCYL